jgi:hypothetical protein
MFLAAFAAARDGELDGRARPDLGRARPDLGRARVDWAGVRRR